MNDDTTPRPWHVIGNRIVAGAPFPDDVEIARTTSPFGRERADADARLIVGALNALDDIVAALARIARQECPADAWPVGAADIDDLERMRDIARDALDRLDRGVVKSPSRTRT